MEIKITDNSTKVKEEFDAAIEKAFCECGFTAQGYAKQTLADNDNFDTGRHRAGIAFGLEVKRLSLALTRKTMEKNYE